MFTTTDPRSRYSLIFVLAILGSFVFFMVKSLNGGFVGFEDNFYEKKLLIKSFNNVRYVLGDRVFPQVLIGKKGWLLFTSDGNLNDYQNAYLFQDRLERIHQQLIVLNQDLKARGIKLIVVVPPNKETIYSDKLPTEIKKLSDQSRLDYFLGMPAEPDFPTVIDLRAPLKQARHDWQIYYQTDTHWNAYGAYVAYREIINSATQIYPDLKPYGLDEFNFTETAPQTLDLSRIMGGDFLTEPRISVQPKFQSTAYFQRIPPLSNISMSWSNSGQARKLLIYHDSFGDALNVFLQYSFKQAVYVRNSTDPGFSTTEWIDTLQPDVVIIEIVERDLIYLDNLLSKLTRGKNR